MTLAPLDLKTRWGLRSLLLGAACAVSVLGVAGCSIGPNYVRPPVRLPAAYQENAGTSGAGALSTRAGKSTSAAAQVNPDWSHAVPADTESRGTWWIRFSDPQLNTLEAQVSVSNQTIQKAVAQLQEARAMVESAHAAYLPTLGPARWRAQPISRACESACMPNSQSITSICADSMCRSSCWTRPLPAIARRLI